MFNFFKRSLIVLLVAMMLAPAISQVNHGMAGGEDMTEFSGVSNPTSINKCPPVPGKRNNLDSDPAFSGVKGLGGQSNQPKRSRSADTRGDFTLLCIRVQFQTDNDTTTTGDGTMMPEHGIGYFNSIFGRMESYFDEISYGEFKLEAEVTENVYTLDHEMKYYGANDNSVERNVNLVNDAVKKADPDVDFNQYGKFIVIHAGSGEESDMWDDSPNDIWSNHIGEYQMWAILGHTISTDDGVTIKEISVVPETQNQDGYYNSNITGVICHEFGHDLGLPDLYDVGYNSNGIGIWGLMGAGGHLNNGITPGHPSAWSKIFLGWADPIEITTNMETVTIRNVEHYPDIYKIIIPHTGGKQYFLIENRARTGFDRYLPAGGLLIWHIDESVLYQNLGGGFTRIDANNVNTDPSRKGVDVEEASGTQDLDVIGNYNSGDRYDPWYNDDEGFTPSSLPNSSDYSNRKTEIHITSISRTSNTMTFSVTVEERKIFLTGPQENSSVEPPGDTAVFDLNLVTNRDTQGDTSDWITLSSEGQNHQWVTFKENPVKVPLKNTQFVTQVYVTVPESAYYLDRAQITISASSNDSTTASETVFLNVSADKITGFSLDPVDDFNILPGPANETIVNLWLNNTGNGEEIYYVSSSWSDDDWFAILNGEYMFSLSLDYVDYLVQGRVKTDLRNAFGDNGAEIENDAKLSDENGIWILRDDPDEYRIEVTDTALEIFNMNHKTVEPYSKARVSLRLYAPWDSLSGDQCIFTIKMTHRADKVTVSFNVTILQIYGVSITPDHTESIARPHLPIIYNFEVMNRGNGQDNVSLKLSGKKAGWNITYEPRYLVLAAGTSAIARVTIFTHDLAPPKDEFVFSMIATSASGKKAETAHCTVTVEEYDEMAVHLLAVNATLKSGQKSVKLDIRLENRGSSDDRYSVVTLEKPTGFSTTVTNYPAGDIPIDAYGVKFLVFQITMTGVKEAGTYSFYIGINSKNNASKLSTFTLNVTVEPVISIIATPDSEMRNVRAGRKVTFYVDIENTANTLVTASLIQKNIPSDIDIDMAPDEPLILRIGKKETIAVEVSTLPGISPGVKTLSFIITLEEGGDEYLLDLNVRVDADPAKVEPTDETPSSSSNLKLVLGIIGLLLVLVLTGVMFFLLRRKKGRDKVPVEEKSPDEGILIGPKKEELGDTVEIYSDFTVETDEGNKIDVENGISTPALPPGETESQGPQVSPPVIVRKTSPIPDSSSLVHRGESTALRSENASSPVAKLGEGAGVSPIRRSAHAPAGSPSLDKSPLALCGESTESPTPKKVRIVKRIDADK